MEKKGKNLSDLQDLNRAQVVRYIVKHPGCSRAELGAVTGLTLASMTKIIRSLCETGVVYETGFAEGKKGRRSVGLSLEYDRYKILAVKLSWRSLDICVFDFQGKRIGEPRSFTFPPFNIATIDNVMSYIVSTCQIILSETPDISAIGVACPGPYYRSSGTFMIPPYSKDPAQRNYYPIQARLEEAFDLPVFIEHDAEAAALAYSWFREADIAALLPDKDPSSAVIMNIFADYSVGIGMTDHGAIIKPNSKCSTELGHILVKYNGRSCPHCGSRGCMDAYCSAAALTAITAEKLPEHPESSLAAAETPDAAAVFSAADEGDAFAQELVSECGRHMGCAIHSLLHVYNPDLVIISGIMRKGGQRLLDGVTEGLETCRNQYTTLPKVSLLPKSGDLVLLGAATIAMDCMMESPSTYMVK